MVGGPLTSFCWTALYTLGDNNRRLLRRPSQLSNAGSTVAQAGCDARELSKIWARSDRGVSSKSTTGRCNDWLASQSKQHLTVTEPLYLL